ncbi:MAG: protein kinase [Clostridiales bacterium]|jgi:hypothetical protein|nr:protein kinase [Clostridiales bacterium]
MAEPFTDDFLSSGFSEGIDLPAQFRGRFDVLECLAAGDFGETYLLSEKGGGKRFILKSYPKSMAGGIHGEGKLLSGLRHKGLPAFEAESEDAHRIFGLREYAEGVSLERYLAERGTLDIPQAAHIAAELCGILSYLHSQPTPVIHRDIKPSNIVIGPGGDKVTLIDFGISRKYAEGSDADTYNFGTKKYAPPEQYGFAQTDCRADIYALGALIRYMLTGAADGAVKDKKLERIAAKCSAFSPKDRYQSAEAVKSALMRHNAWAGGKAVLFAALALALCLSFAAGFAAGRHTGFFGPALPAAQLPAPAGESAVVFSEPLIEKAVRQALGFDAVKPVAPRDLAAVQEIYIIGADVLTEEAYMQRTGADGHICVRLSDRMNASLRGGIRTLADLKGMKNLRKLAVILQGFTDVSPLAGLPLEYLALCGNSITDADIASLKECPYLSALYVDGTDFAGLSGVRELPPLDMLSFRDTKVAAIRPLKGLQIRGLILPMGGIADLAPLAGLPLTELHLGYYPEDVDFICSLSTLEILRYVESGITSLEPFERLPYLKKLVVSGNGLKDMEGIQHLPQLRNIIVSHNPLTDISAFRGHPALADLEINDCPLEDFDPLFGVPNLRNVLLDSRQESLVRDILPNPGFQVHIRDEQTARQGASARHCLRKNPVCVRGAHLRDFLSYYHI